jgi:DNA-binding NarL/FixJ family response regulator
MPTRPAPGLKILLLEDDPLDAELLTHHVRQTDPNCAVLRVDTAGTFKRALEAFVPDVVLSDRGVTGFNSLDALRTVQARRSEAPFLMVAGAFDPIAGECLKGGAAGFVLKSELSRLGPAIAAALESRAPLRTLSERQRQVLRLLAGGASMREIAKQLRLSVKTVETHRAEVMKRLGIRHLAGLVRYAIMVGIVSAGD